MKKQSMVLFSIFTFVATVFYLYGSVPSPGKPSPIMRLKGTWRVDCKVSTFGYSGGVYSGSTEPCQKKDYQVQISEKPSGTLTFVLQTWEHGEVYTFFLKRGSEADTYLLSVDMDKDRILDALPLSYSEEKGFFSGGTEASKYSATIKFTADGGHSWQANTKGPNFEITFLPIKKTN